jgi:hypothetical protein
MPEYEVDGEQPVYDHETEDHRSGRRRAPVADWGVGEELFDRLPARRRFNRASEPHRRDSHPRERAVPADERDADERDEAQAPPVAEVAPEPAPSVLAEEPRIEVPGGRRTVVIGRSRDVAPPPRPERRPRTMGDRLTHRPDRLAMWAVALGMLLILIAILTAGS